MREVQRRGKILIFAIFVGCTFGRSVAEVYDVTTIYKFGVPYSDVHEDRFNYVPTFELNEDGRNQWDYTGWTNTNLGQINVRTPFSDDKYEVLDGGVTSIVPIPSEEFVVSFRSSGSEIFIFLLANDDVIESDMIMIVLSSQPYASICQNFREGIRKMIPNNRSRKCLSTPFSYNHGYEGSNEYSSLFVKLSPDFEVSMPEEPSGSRFLPPEFFEAYEKIEKFKIKFVSIGVSSGSASFQLWPSFRTLSLSQHQGMISKRIMDHGNLVCLSLKYYLQPNSGAFIKVLIENEDNDDVISLGTVTAAPHEDNQIAFMTTQEFISRVETDRSTRFRYKILAERNSALDTVLISAINTCHDTEFPNIRSINERGTAEVHVMTNARGLPILLHNGTAVSSYIGVVMEECTPLDGGCAWILSNWTNKSVETEENPPLKLSEKKSFVEYTFNSISTHHIFHNKELHFTFSLYDITSQPILAIFLMANNPNVKSGDMYYITLEKNYNYYYYRYVLNKCTSLQNSDSTSIPGEMGSRGCKEMTTPSDINTREEIDGCGIEIKLSSGTLNVILECDSTKETIIQWTDPDPLDIVYYRFGTYNVKSEFHINIDDPLVWSLASEEGSLVSPTFIPDSRTLCVCLTYYLPLTTNNSLELSIHWAGDDSQDFHPIQATGEWKTARFVVKLPETKRDKQMSVVLKGRRSDGSNVFIQRIGGCYTEGFEDVLVLSDGGAVNIQNIGYDVAMVQFRTTNYIYFKINCTNGGVFDEERGGCVCPAGFTGSTCERGCGANRFGAACNGLCSKTKQGCQRMVLCRPTLGCSCASGLKGILCDKNCDSREYGAGCKQRCGHCKDYGYCDNYSGECPSGCELGYYPPICQQTYMYLSKAPVVTATEVQALKITANLQFSKGEGTPTFYQFQYRECIAVHSSWLELEPLPIVSDDVSGNITELKSGITYQVRVVLLDRDGDSYQGPDVPYAEVTTHCTVPDSINYDLRATEISEDSFQISWKNPSWCAVTRYELEHKDGLRWLKLYQGQEMTAKLSNLLLGQEYEIRVRAFFRKEAFPFSDVLLITTKVGAPDAVRELRVLSRTSHQLEVVWTPPGNAAGNIRRYKISYQCQKLLACKSENCSHSSGEVEVTTSPIVLRNLLSYAQYSVSVAGLSVSWGPAKQLLTVTDMAAPSVSPEPNSTSPVTHRTNSSFIAHWKPPHNCTYLNGYLYNYRYELTSPNNNKQLIEGITHLTSANFTDLIPHTLYMVKVYLVTSGGWGTRHPLEIPAQTRATTPDHVEQLVVYKRGRRMLGVRWASPKQTYGSLKSFTVSYQTPGREKRTVKSEIKPIPCLAWPHLFCHTINHLQPETEYTILVQAQNAEVAEIGEPASVTAATKESAPVSPPYIHVVNQTQMNLTIEWGLPDLVNGVLRSFIVNIEEVESFNSTECCQYFPVQEVTVQSEKSNYRLEFSGLQPASSYTISVSAKTVSLGPAVSITTYTRPPIPSMDNIIEFPDDSSSFKESLTVLIHPSTEYQDLIRGYLLFVLPASNATEVPKTTLFEDWLIQEVKNHVNGTYYLASEFDQVDLEENPEITVGSGQDLKVGKWGEMQNPVLKNEMDYRLGLVVILDYSGVHSVGYAETYTFHVQY